VSSSASDSPRRRAPRGTLNQQVIVAAAIKIIETHGLDALSTRGLARALDVRQTALYTHFPDKEAILRAVAMELFARFKMPDSAASDGEMLRALIRAYFRLLIDNPVLVQLASLPESVSETEARVFEALYGCLHRLGIDHRNAAALVASLSRYVLGSATMYPARHKWEEEPSLWERHRDQLATLPPERYPAIHDVLQNLPTLTQEEVFEYGLEALLNAVDAAGGTQAGG
jgi:AcrR family transcriptional regulator